MLMMLSLNIYKLTDCSYSFILYISNTNDFNFVKLVKTPFTCFAGGLLYRSISCRTDGVVLRMSVIAFNISHEWHKGYLTHPKADCKSVSIGPVVTIKLSQNVLNGLFLVIFFCVSLMMLNNNSKQSNEYRIITYCQIIISGCRQTQKQWYAD